ncbi:FAD-binding domain-containing protein [Schizophyllum commune H4-8]|uniref:FAD-binding domain-containing protein n=1 Tax=Schizophyllum commune (strain H4-8 / FGSC 9210) TaxID=578458 RepID=UPI00215F7069|nr:FAD-binding domain-containing protein [Schizophyllum commune H4-8]KAI5892433.1 FAD-binding domain-containing protein [Schizophyllum commune H4-8]
MSLQAHLANFPAGFKGDIVTRDHPGYEEAIRRWSRSAERRAAVVAYIKDAEDAAIAIAYARAHELPIAIKGGGHSSAGASSVEDGLVIDCSRYLRYCRVDPVRKTARVGGGTLWEMVDKAAYEHGLATVGGTVNDTGIAGLTLGGGFGYLSGQHGLALDNMIEATVVLADGTILLASATKHADLFFGIRGGGSNFGVITEFVFRLHEQKPMVFSGFLSFRSSDIPRLVNAIEHYWQVQDPRACMFMTFSAKNGIRCLIFYDGSRHEAHRHFARFFGIGPTSNTAKEIPYVEANATLNETFKPGASEYQKSIGHPVPTVSLLEELNGMVKAYGAADGPSPIVIFSFWPKKRLMEHHVTECAFRHDPYPDLALIAIYKSNTPENLTMARARVYELYDFVRGFDAMSGMSTSALAGYANNDDEAASTELEKRAKRSREAFGDVYPRLQEIKKKYDPDMVFNRWYPIIPA